jgi:Predicted membrane protein (DUF2232)
MPLSPLAQAILVATLAGVATALLSGLLTPGALTMALFSLLAPTPLFIAGFGWHPLVAALAGLIAALTAQVVSGTTASLMITGMLALPAFGVTLLAERLFGSYAGRPEKDGIDLGRLAVTIVLYVGIAGVVVGLIMEPDYAGLEARVRKAIDLAFTASGLAESFAQADAANLARLLDLMASIMLPMSALISLMTLVVSSTLGVQIADRADRMRFARPDFRRFRLPGGSLILLIAALFIASRAGYLGLLGEIVALGLVFFYMLHGFSVLHARTIGFGARGLMLAAAWLVVILFTIPAVVFILVGLFDHLFDFRRGRL